MTVTCLQQNWSRAFDVPAFDVPAFDVPAFDVPELFKQAQHDKAETSFDAHLTRYQLLVPKPGVA
jgi:hypothetical protein